MLDRLLGHCDRLARVAVLAGGGMIFVAALLVSVDVVARKVLGVSLGGADELSGYALAIATTWGLAFVVLARGNVRVDALYQYLPRKACALLDLVALAALALFGVLLARYSWGVLETSWSLASRSNTPLQTPLWIPQGLWVLGLALFVATLAALMLRAAAAFVSGDLAAVQRLAGARSIQEEAAEEAHHGAVIARRADGGAPQ